MCVFGINAVMYVCIYLLNELSEVLTHCNMIPFYQGKKKASLCSFFFLTGI